VSRQHCYCTECSDSSGQPARHRQSRCHLGKSRSNIFLSYILPALRTVSPRYTVPLAGSTAIARYCPATGHRGAQAFRPDDALYLRHELLHAKPCCSADIQIVPVRYRDKSSIRYSRDGVDRPVDINDGVRTCARFHAGCTDRRSRS
jgi:hypothetical protein